MHDTTPAVFRRTGRLTTERRPGEVDRAVARARRGDQDAIRWLYERFAGNVYGYACSIVRDEHDAEDVTQQVFARLLTALATYERRGAPFSAWLLRVTHNTAIDTLRRRTVVAEISDVEAGPDDEAARHAARTLQDALRELPEGQREVVVLRHVLGLSPGEIAEQLGRSEDAVHGLHHRGRRALRKALALGDASPVVVAA